MTDIKVEIKNGKANLYTPYNADFVKAIKALYEKQKDSLPDGVTVEVIEESEPEKKEEKAVDEVALAEYARRVDHVMHGKNPEIVAITKKAIQDAYSRKAEAVDKTEEEKALAFASGVLYGCTS